MEFAVERKALLKALNHIKRVVETRNTIPILANVMLTVQTGKLTLTGTDMEIAVVESVAAEMTGDGSCTAPAATLYDMVNKLPDAAMVQFSHPGGDANLKVRSGRFSTSMVVLPVEDYPMMTAGSLPHKFRLAAALLSRLLDRTRFAMSTEETRYYLNGIYLHTAENDAGDKVLRAVSTDGHRLARVDEELPEGADGMPSIIVPRKTVNELKMFDDTDGEVEVAVSDTRVQFSAGPLMLTSKLVDGSYPDYVRVIPTTNDKILKVGGQGFSRVIARVAAISGERSQPVKISLSDGYLGLSASSAEKGSAVEEIDDNDFSYTAGPMDVGFQARYLNDIMGLIEGDAELRLSDGNAPVLIGSAGDASAVYVLMPMRV